MTFIVKQGWGSKRMGTSPTALGDAVAIKVPAGPLGKRIYTLGASFKGTTTLTALQSAYPGPRSRVLLLEGQTDVLEGVGPANLAAVVSGESVNDFTIDDPQDRVRVLVDQVVYQPGFLLVLDRDSAIPIHDGLGVLALMFGPVGADATLANFTWTLTLLGEEEQVESVLQFRDLARPGKPSAAAGHPSRSQAVG
jgi:hypothetical protein